MKLRNLLMLFVALIILSSCHKTNVQNPNTKVQAAFDAQYPDATYLTWEMKGIYHVAEFRQNRVEKNAWFTAEGDWKLGEYDIVFNNLPQAVRDAFNASNYANWHIDDVDCIDRPDMPIVYVIEVEKNETDADLYYAADGTLIRIELDNDTNDYETEIPVTIPQVIYDYISANHPMASIVEIDLENNHYEVDIIENFMVYELLFNLDGSWISTHMDD